MRIIVEGIDRLGKSTFINNILKSYGAHPIIHCSAPPKGIADPAKYQEEYFTKCFKMLNQPIDVIFDRCHLGEYIYGPLYRKTDPNFIFDIETKHNAALIHTDLVLLYTKDFSIMEDDGLSFDFSAREKEQELFIEAYNKSSICRKIMIRVDEQGRYRNDEHIFNEFKRWYDEY